MSNNFNYGTGTLTSAIALDVALGRMKAVLNKSAVEKVKASEQHVRDIVESKRSVYGVNTGFGILSTSSISAEDTITLQHRILQSHSLGVGDPIPEEVAKLMLITKVHALAQGYSGVQLTTLERICWHIDNNVIPVVPEKGSVGA